MVTFVKIFSSSSLNINHLKTQSKPAFSASQENVSSPLNSELKSPSADTLKAYNNLAFKGEPYVSEESVFKFLDESGFKFTQRFPEIADSLKDKDGKISEKAFKVLKNLHEKKSGIWESVRVLNVSKEDGKINYDALSFLNGIVKAPKSSYSMTPYGNILNGFKDSSGTFNKKLLNLAIANEEAFSEVLHYDGGKSLQLFKNDENKFSKDAIDFLEEKLESATAFRTILGMVRKAKGENGEFSLSMARFNDSLSENFDAPKQYLLKEICAEKPEKQEKIFSLAQKLKDEKEFTDIFELLNKVQDTPSKFDFDEDSAAFAKTILKIFRGRVDESLAVAKVFGSSKKNFSEILTEKNIKTLERLANTVQSEDFGLLSECAVYKNGEKKGEFSFENLEKYIDIYNSRYHPTSRALLKNMNKCLSLEEDDRVLNVFHRLCDLKWETKFGNEERLDVPELNLVMDLSTMNPSDENSPPKRKFLPSILNNLERLLEMKLPLESKEAFQNFMLIPDFDCIEKLERVNLSELGFDSGQTTCGAFYSADEKSLMNFKEFLKEFLKDRGDAKGGRKFDLVTNANIASMIEVSTGQKWDRKTLIFDLKKGEPVTEISTSTYQNRFYRKEKDHRKNTESSARFTIKKNGFDEYNVLNEQEFKQFDKNGNLVYKEEMKPSCLEGVFDITKTNADGSVEKVCRATKDHKTGNETIEKNMTSFDGTKSYYRYEDDPDGNRIIDYKIKDADGKTLLDSSVTFEVLGENHFVSSRNNLKFDVKVNADKLFVKDLQSLETAEIDLENFTKSTKNDLLPLLKKIPGEELMAMKKLDLKSLSTQKDLSGAHFNSVSEEIVLGGEFKDLAILLHEWGHGKDSLKLKALKKEIMNNEELKEIYNDEKQAFRDKFSDSQLEHVGYFAADCHYLGASRAIKEGIAETNTLLSVYPKNDIQAARSHYWQQYFPRTIAHLAGMLCEA